MIEIIPNWHPVLVHFTIGLLAISTALYPAASTWMWVLMRIAVVHVKAIKTKNEAIDLLSITTTDIKIGFAYIYADEVLIDFLH